MTRSPFHPGERAAQEKAGEAQRAALVGRAVGNIIPAPVAVFISRQNMAIVTTRDAQANIWTSLLAGRQGFLSVADEQTINIDLSSIKSNPLDPFWQNIRSSPKIGMLFIEPATRRRFRVNGRISISGENIQILVEQAYPNCRKYIRLCEIELSGTGGNLSAAKTEGAVLTADLQAWITRSDTFFVGSSDAEGNPDASHRGGEPGFVRVVNESTLRIPDYPGNSMFNTLGNFSVNPKSGLLFVDFKERKMLQLIGKAEILWQAKETEEVSSDTMRLWDFHVFHWRQTNSIQLVG